MLEVSMTATHFDNSELSLKKGLRLAIGMTKYFETVKKDTLYLKF